MKSVLLGASKGIGYTFLAIGIIFYLSAGMIYEGVTQKLWHVTGVLGILCLSLSLLQSPTWIFAFVVIVCFVFWISFQLYAEGDR